MNSFMYRLAIAASASAALLAGSAAVAAAVDSVTAEELAAALTEAGLPPTVVEDAQTGAPVLNANVGDVQFWVRALDCSGKPAACENLVFFANFDLGRAVEPTDFRVVNHFNDSQLFGRAYILEARNEVGVEYVIELGGGVTPAHLSQNIARWADIIQAFIQKFSSGDTGA